MIDKLLQQVMVKTERAESLSNNKSANWLIVQQSEKAMAMATIEEEEDQNHQIGI